MGMNNQDQNKAVSFADIIDFEKACIVLSNKLIQTIDKIGRIELPDKIAAHIRVLIFIFVQDVNKFFIQRSNFILELLPSNRNLEILRNIYRGLIETYCRVLYLNTVDEIEKIKIIMWREFYATALTCKGLPSALQKRALPALKLHYMILKARKVPFPDFQKILLLVRDDLLFRKSDATLRNLKKECEFPSVRRVIKDYFDENDEPKIFKLDLYFYYCIFSEQLHGNTMLEFSAPSVNPKYQLVFWLILFHLKMLQETTRMVNLCRDDVTNLIIRYNSEIKVQLAVLRNTERDMLIKWGV